MKILRVLLVTSLLGTGLAACGDSSPVTPGSPRFDGGFTFGGGNRDGGATTTSTASDSTGTERGGFTFGGGN
ncbi:MAG TPA: hypothetical protein VHG28_02220 [Longimicrobiaceae bacterium]|nr:hypothetical protein [Longimicrobiaceae bacterium]